MVRSVAESFAPRSRAALTGRPSGRWSKISELNSGPLPAQPGLSHRGGPARAVADDPGGGLGASIRVEAVTGSSLLYLDAALGELKETSPRANITLDALPSRDRPIHLAAGETGFVLAWILPECDSRDCDIQPLQHEKVVLKVRRGHQLSHALRRFWPVRAREWGEQPLDTADAGLSGAKRCHRAFVG